MTRNLYHFCLLKISPFGRNDKNNFRMFHFLLFRNIGLIKIIFIKKHRQIANVCQPKQVNCLMLHLMSSAGFRSGGFPGGVSPAYAGCHDAIGTEVDKIHVMRNRPKLRTFQKNPPPAPANGGHYLLHTIYICNYDTVSCAGVTTIFLNY